MEALPMSVSHMRECHCVIVERSGRGEKPWEEKKKV